MSRAWSVFVLLQALVLAQVALAWADGFLTVPDMQARGYETGLPLMWHFGVWGDVLLISPLVSFIVGRYAAQWRASQFSVVMALTVLITLLLGWFYTTGNIPGSHVHEHQTTLAGRLHLVYMAASITVFALFYLYTDATPNAVLGVTLLVIAHVFFGTQLALGLLKRLVHLPWYPHQPLLDPGAWVPFLAAVAFCVWRARQMRAAKHRGV